MTVTRRGDQDQPSGFESLGKVLVTIDDLEALVAVIRQHSPDGAGEPQLKFFGGTFTDPSDLRTLTDREMEQIEIVNPKIEVSLASYGAYATGDADLTKIVDNTWARSRQTPDLPKSRYRDARNEQLVTAAALAIAVLAVPILALIWKDSLRWARGLPSLAIIVALGRVYLRKRQRRWDTYAVIIPTTLDDYRKEQTIGKRQLVTWLIATSAVAVTLLGILVGVLIKR
jgi:hypothetical protein